MSEYLSRQENVDVFNKIYHQEEQNKRLADADEGAIRESEIASGSLIAHSSRRFSQSIREQMMASLIEDDQEDEGSDMAQNGATDVHQIEGDMDREEEPAVGGGQIALVNRLLFYR